MKVRFIAKWYDFWVGWFWDRNKRRLYVLPVSCIGICFDFGAPGGLMNETVKRYTNTVRGLVPSEDGGWIPYDSIAGLAAENAKLKAIFCEAHDPSDDDSKICPCCEAMHQADLAAKLRGERASAIHIMQTYQPGGSPPPGDWLVSLQWILSTLQAERGKLAAECRRLVRRLNDRGAEIVLLEAQKKKLEAELAAAQERVKGLERALRDCMGYIDVDNLTMQSKYQEWQQALTAPEPGQPRDWKPGEHCMAGNLECEISSVWGGIAILIPIGAGDSIHFAVEALRPVAANLEPRKKLNFAFNEQSLDSAETMPHKTIVAGGETVIIPEPGKETK